MVRKDSCRNSSDCNAYLIQSYLNSQHSKIKLYLHSDEHIKPEEVHSGHVIMATNLAGRQGQPGSARLKKRNELKRKMIVLFGF